MSDTDQIDEQTMKDEKVRLANERISNWILITILFLISFIGMMVVGMIIEKGGESSKMLGSLITCIISGIMAIFFVWVDGYDQGQKAAKKAVEERLEK